HRHAYDDPSGRSLRCGDPAGPQQLRPGPGKRRQGTPAAATAEPRPDQVARKLQHRRLDRRAPAPGVRRRQRDLDGAAGPGTTRCPRRQGDVRNGQPAEHSGPHPRRAGNANHAAARAFLARNGKKKGVVTTASGLEYQVLKAGQGSSPKAGDMVTVNYRGKLLDGKEFDSSYKRGQPASFPVDRVIPGWQEALELMKPGAKWRIFVPPRLAYDLNSPPA